MRAITLTVVLIATIQFIVADVVTLRILSTVAILKIALVAWDLQTNSIVYSTDS
jgi:hypothetical protein